MTKIESKMFNKKNEPIELNIHGEGNTEDSEIETQNLIKEKKETK